MSLQVCEGDVIRGQAIPMILVWPRYFTCPNTNNDLFGLNFQVSLNITFSNGYFAAETFDLILKRH